MEKNEFFPLIYKIVKKIKNMRNTYRNSDCNYENERDWLL